MARIEMQPVARLFECSRTGVSLTEADLRYRDAVAEGFGALGAGAADAATLSARIRTKLVIACAERYRNSS